MSRWRGKQKEKQNKVKNENGNRRPGTASTSEAVGVAEGLDVLLDLPLFIIHHILAVLHEVDLHVGTVLQSGQQLFQHKQNNNEGQ